MRLSDLLAKRLNGLPLRAMARSVRTPAGARLGAQMMEQELGFDRLWDLVDGSEALDLNPVPRAGRPPRPAGPSAAAPESPPWVATAATYTAAYGEGLSPERVVERLYRESERLHAQKPWLACLWTRADAAIMSEARASAARYQAGAPLSPIDGVPIVVKEELAVRGLPRRMGSVLPGAAAMAADAVLVERLRAQGALIVGQTAMTELGLSPLGVGAQRPGLRNPHDAERAPGGSSTGSGVAAALGLSAIAVGCDGGGSIRIPSALSGVFGLKPSYGRVPRTGDAFSGSLNVAGPLALSVLDLACFMDIASGPDPHDPASLAAPSSTRSFASAVACRAAGLRIGVDQEELRDAEPDVVRACETALRALEEAGCILVDVRMPLARHAPALGVITISAETRATQHYWLRRHPGEHSPDVSLLLALAGGMETDLYLLAQTLRERLRQQLRQLFRDVDLVALPTTRVTAPRVSAADDATGRVDARGTRDLVRHTFLANLAGLPAASAPVGLDREGLPIGLQLLADAWDEATLLTALAELERSGAARVPRSPHHIDLLSG